MFKKLINKHTGLAQEMQREDKLYNLMRECGFAAPQLAGRALKLAEQLEQLYGKDSRRLDQLEVAMSEQKLWYGTRTNTWYAVNPNISLIYREFETLREAIDYVNKN